MVTLTMCSTTGIGEAKKRKLSGVIAAPLASVVSRNVPAAMGMKASAISAVGMSQSALLEEAMLRSSRMSGRSRRKAVADGAGVTGSMLRETRLSGG